MDNQKTQFAERDCRKKDKKAPSETFLRNFGLFSDRTRAIIDKQFTLVLRILFFKYKRKAAEYKETLRIRDKKNKKKKLHEGPLLLKEKDISDTMLLVDFHLNNKFNIHVENHKDLMANFGNFPLEYAEKWYGEYLVKCEVKDVMDRRIFFAEVGKKFLYKEHTAEGAHIVAPENYTECRGRRLSWIKPLLSQTREIYRQTERYWETFLYLGIFKIRIKKDTLMEESFNNYFLIVTRRKSGQRLEFVTAYFTESQDEIFKHLEPARPLTRREQEHIKQIEKKN